MSNHKSNPNRLNRLAIMKPLVGMTAALLLLNGFHGQVGADDDALHQQASWSPVSSTEVREQLLNWVESQELDELNRLKIESLCDEASSNESFHESNLDLFAMVVPIAVPESNEFISDLRSLRSSTATPDSSKLEVFGDDAFLSTNMHLLYGRWLCQNDFYDEALHVMSDVDVEHVLDPAALLFYRGVAAQRILDKDQTIDSLEQLLENRGKIPRRYERLADLMLVDIRPLEEDSLDEIARLMDDIHRRQMLHRSGVQVRDEEASVVEKLDKLIKELEEQMNPSSGSGSGASAPSAPMEQSRAGGGGGAGNVDRRNQTPGRQWGNLDPHDRSAALAELAKDLPAHYREVIEEYFRRLAEDDKNHP